MLFERYQQQSGLWEKWESRGLCAISKGGGKGGKPAFGFPPFPRTGFFHSPAAAAFCFCKKYGSSLSSENAASDSTGLLPFLRVSSLLCLFRFSLEKYRARMA